MQRDRVFSITEKNVMYSYLLCNVSSSWFPYNITEEAADAFEDFDLIEKI